MNTSDTVTNKTGEQASQSVDIGTICKLIAHRLAAYHNCQAKGNTEWEAKHMQAIEDCMKRTAPSGSGIDCGTKLDDSSTPDKLVFTLSYHHMDEHGSYAGWTDHTVIVTPSLAFGFNLKITGRDRNQIKEYLHEVYQGWLSTPCNIWGWQ